MYIVDNYTLLISQRMHNHACRFIHNFESYIDAESPIVIFFFLGGGGGGGGGGGEN